uniref:Uncharacterized protein n=1 Tax=Eutreptiella gymnastica TaxID=73025 RepID=A0A7S4FQM3_9EUGL
MYRRALAICPAHYGTVGNFFMFLYQRSDIAGCKDLAPEFCRSRRWSASVEFRRDNFSSAAYNAYLALCSQPRSAEALKEYTTVLQMTHQTDRLAELKAKGVQEVLRGDSTVTEDRMVQFWYNVWWPLSLGPAHDADNS